MSNKDMPAYPVSEEETDRIDAGIKIYTGLTKLEAFTMAALQGLCSNSSLVDMSLDVPGWNRAHIAVVAANLAEAALAELEVRNV